MRLPIVLALFLFHFSFLTRAQIIEGNLGAVTKLSLNGQLGTSVRQGFVLDHLTYVDNKILAIWNFEQKIYTYISHSCDEGNRGWYGRILSLLELRTYFLKLDSEPRFGSFGNDDPASDFVFVAK